MSMIQASDSISSPSDARGRAIRPSRPKLGAWYWGLLLVFIAAALFGVTLQTDINGSSDRYLEDVGEFQNVLTQWGTAHPTGYPLYSFSGAAFASLLRAAGIGPATATSIYSAVIGLLALVGVYALLLAWKVSPPLAAGAALLLAVLFPFWLYASVAATRTLLIALIVASFVIVARWWSDRNPRHLTELAFVVGLGIGHHRLAMLVIPGLMIYAGPLIITAVRERPARLLVAIASLLASFLIYLYLPIRAWMNGSWIYGQPGTWDGFWAIVSQREYGSLVRAPADLAAIGSGFKQVFDTLGMYLTWPIALLGALGLALVLIDKSRRRVSLALMAVVVTNVAFAGVFPRAVLLLSAMMPAMLTLVMGVGLLAQIVAGQSRFRSAAVGAALAAGVGALIVVNGPSINSLTHDSSSRTLIQNIVNTGLDQSANRPVVMALWGRDFFALAYAQSVTGELVSMEMVDHRANVQALIASGRPLYVLSPTFYQRPLNWWDSRLGNAYLSSYAGDLVRVSDRPILSEADLPSSSISIPMGTSIVLRGWHVKRSADQQSWQITLYWQAATQPNRDYSVFLHASDRTSIDRPEAIVSQADRAAPVYGWYPTSRWSPGEIVRDDYVITPPPDRPAKIVAVGLYYQDEAGNFHNLGEQIIPLD